MRALRPAEQNLRLYDLYILWTVDCYILLKLNKTHQESVLNKEREALQNHIGNVKKRVFCVKKDKIACIRTQAGLVEFH